jgi:hypothetical protein
MGRASGRHSSTFQGRTRNQEAHPVSWVSARLQPYIGLDVSDHGYLDEPYGGHDAGTPYVVITADCAMDREKARAMLEDFSGLPELAWECGWRGRVLPSGKQHTELRLFPTPSPL